MNALQFETSPYLLQHQHNPVDWHPWTDSILTVAREQDKLIIISIGYAACHWCHVMEHECFENVEVAEVMNRSFISIKIDREERPDIDQLYMNVAMLLNGQGGWPLNIVALPDGKPIFAGTYFPKLKWMQVLNYFATMYQEKKDNLIQQAQQITLAIQQLDQIAYQQAEQVISELQQKKIWDNWKNKIDDEWGGKIGAPKFMMPNNYEYLMRYSKRNDDDTIKKFIKTTLKKLAFGGIHDVVGGGFARYSVDAQWKVPHFEKMLYDNGQLMSVYAQAYQLTKRPLYKAVVQNIAKWIENEMTDDSGGLYSSLDADSEGVEGKYYCWTYNELKMILKDDFLFFIDVYNIELNGNFEYGLNVLFRTEDHEYFMDKYKMSNADFQNKIQALHHLLFENRKHKIRPATDDKILTEWNAIALKGYCDAYNALGDDKYLKKAVSIATFILTNLKKEDYRLDRNYKNGKSSINGFLTDYAFLIDALIALYQITLETFYLTEAHQFTKHVIAHFYNSKNGMFYFTSNIDTALITRGTDSSDNVIPSANSTMAKNLLLLSKYFTNTEFENMSTTMLNNVLEEVVKTPIYYSNWAIVLDMHLHLKSELIITGKNATDNLKRIREIYFPDILIGGSKTDSNIPILTDRFIADKTLYYFCQNNTCALPEVNFNQIQNKLFIFV